MKERNLSQPLYVLRVYIIIHLLYIVIFIESTISSALVHKEENTYKSFFTIIKDFSTLYIKIYCHRCFAVQTNMYVATNVLSLNIHAEKSLLLYTVQQIYFSKQQNLFCFALLIGFLEKNPE